MLKGFFSTVLYSAANIILILSARLVFFVLILQNCTYMCDFYYAVNYLQLEFIYGIILVLNNFAQKKTFLFWMFFLFCSQFIIFFFLIALSELNSLYNIICYFCSYYIVCERMNEIFFFFFLFQHIRMERIKLQTGPKCRMISFSPLLIFYCT